MTGCSCTLRVHLPHTFTFLSFLLSAVFCLHGCFVSFALRSLPSPWPPRYHAANVASQLNRCDCTASPVLCHRHIRHTTLFTLSPLSLLLFLRTTMPGREPQPPSRTGTETHTTARRAATASSTAPYTRRAPLSTSSLSAQQSREGGATSRCGHSTTTTAGRSGPTASPSPAPQERCSPACATCVACYRASEGVATALSAVLANAKALMMDDAVHHYSGDEAWIRVLRALGYTDGGVHT